MKKKLFLLLASLFFFFIGHLYAVDPLTTNYIENDYTGNWGKLKLVGTQLSSQSGQPVQLKGWSTHGWQFGNVRKITFDSKAGFEGMKSFGANVARIAAYMSPYDNVEDDMVQDIIDWVKRCMAWTNELNMYCIVDFHVHDPGFPSYYLIDRHLGRDAEDFFTQICNEVNSKGYNHVLYEICNEPSGKRNVDYVGTISPARQWENVKIYVDRILPIIEYRDPNAVVIVGTPNSCLRLDVAAGSPILTGENSNLNIMYTFHFYACSHINDFNTYLKTYSSQIPVFATEWSVTAADGTGSACYDNATAFTDYCRDNKISWCSWSWSAKNETSAALRNAAYDASWSYVESNLTTAGSFVKGKLQESSSSSLQEVRNISFGIYPNPVKDGVFNVSLEDNTSTAITISNVQGKNVYTSIIESKDATINANLKTGTYIVTVKNENGTGTQKLLVE